MAQSDRSFVEACGYLHDFAAGDLALALRRNLAKYGGHEPESINANSEFRSLGLFLPPDSIDLIEYSLGLERVTLIQLRTEEVLSVISPDREDHSVGDWVSGVVALVRERGGLDRRSVPCARCGFDLRGHVDPTCSECGHVWP